MKLFYSDSDETLNRLLREVVDASFLETFKIILDRPLSNLIQLKLSLHWRGFVPGDLYKLLPTQTMLLFCIS